MLKSIAIIAGEPNSISSEIIFKFWKSRKKFYHKPIFIIGGVELLNRQFKKLKYKIPIKEINFDFKIKNLTGNKLPVYNVKYKEPVSNFREGGISTQYNFWKWQYSITS